MGLRCVGPRAPAALLAVLLAVVAGSAAVAASSRSPARGAAEGSAVRYLLARQQPDGGFAEPGRTATPGLTAWAVIGLRAAGVPPGRLAGARGFLAQPERTAAALTDEALLLVARAALGDRAPTLAARIRAAAPGSTVNSAVWSIIALRAAGETPSQATVASVLAAQTRAGGWSWVKRGTPDSNDTAAAIQALRAAGVRGRPIARGIAFLRRLRAPSGGFRLLPGRSPDTQSTAWTVQAFLAAGLGPPRGALGYVARQQRRDGSIRYSSRYAVTPVWVTSQALAALARRSLPLPAP